MKTDTPTRRGPKANTSQAKYFNLRFTPPQLELAERAARHEEERLGGSISINTFCVRAVISAAREELQRK